MDEENIEYEMDSGSDSESEDSFLADLGSDKFKEKPVVDKEQVKIDKMKEKEMKQIFMQNERESKKRMREQKQQEAQEAKEAKKSNKTKKTSSPPDDDGLFSNTGTEILGRERIMLLKKVQQYKTLFPDELKTFKVKKSPSVEELKDVLEEMSVLVEVGSLDSFMLDSILQCMKLVEGASSVTNYDITGCADMLKSNAEFHRLCKMLFIKYGVFSKVPPEMQLLMLVSTTSYLCIQKNKSKSSINAYLNSTI